MTNSAPIIHTEFKALIGDMMPHVCMSGVIDLQGRVQGGGGLESIYYPIFAIFLAGNQLYEL